PDSALETSISAAAANAPRVRLELGYLEDQDLLDRIAAADWLVAPYRAIENPTALELAVAYGRPVIAPRLPAVVEALGDHECLLYDPDGEIEDELARAFSEAAARPSANVDGHANVGADVDAVAWADQARATIAVYQSLS
ncbi:MAG TPA: hypothetical protein VGO97_05090, partial [Solirubrobacterales bacterium]|nr:hypothetical protein [Solirubrobacterales bacterium]